MTLKEAITHLEKDVYRDQFPNEAVKKEQEQILAWLKDYSVLRDRVSVIQDIISQAAKSAVTADEGIINEEVLS